MSKKDTGREAMSENDEIWEQQVEAMSKQFDFPPTPDIAGLVEGHLHTPRYYVLRRAIAPTLMLLVFICIGVLMIPDLRAIASDVLQIGGIQLLKEKPSRDLASDGETSNAYVESIRAIATEVSLDATRQAVDMGLPLPTYPDGVGLPDRVFLRRAAPMIVILVWLDPADAQSILFSLQIMPNTVDARKYYDDEPQTIYVRGTVGFWLTEPHLFSLQLSNTEGVFERWVEKDVLIWQQNNVTFRIESDLPLDTVEQIAESLTVDP